VSNASTPAASETLTFSEIAAAAEKAAPGRVAYDLVREPNYLTITSEDGEGMREAKRQVAAILDCRSAP
jgi:hypothetical protein